MDNHIIETTTSRPRLSPPSHLKLSMPSVSLFQYAPDAECIPLLPTFGLFALSVAAAAAPADTGSALISVPSASFFSAKCWIASPVLGCAWMSVLVLVLWVPAEAVEVEGSDRCWMMVLLTANL